MRLAFLAILLVVVDAFIIFTSPPRRQCSLAKQKTRLNGAGRQRDNATRHKRSRTRDSYVKQQRPSPEVQRALDLFRSNVTQPHAFPLDTLSTREQVHLIQELERSNGHDIIFRLVQKHDTLQQQVLEAAIVALSSAPSHQSQILDILKQDKIQSLSSSTCASLFDNISSDVEAAVLMDELQHYNNSVQVWNAALRACRRQGDAQGDDHDNWQVALSMLRDMKRSGVTPNERSYGEVLNACAQVGQVRIALSLLKELQHQSQSTKSKLSPQIWGAALHACAKAGTLHDAISILQYMTSQNIPINTVHISAFLSTCAKVGRDDIARQLLESFRREDPFHSPEYNLVIPSTSVDLVVMNTVLLACAKAGNYGAAKSILQEIKQGAFDRVEHPDVISYNTVLSACHDPTEAKAIVKEMRMSRRHRYGAVPPTSITYTHAITACRQSADVESARFLLDSARNDGIEPNVYMYSAAIWSCGNDGDSALELLDEMRSNDCAPNIVSYNGVLSALALQASAEEALSLFEEMKDDKLKPNRVTFHKLASAIRTSKEDIAKSEMLEHVLRLMNPFEMRASIGGPILEALIRQYGAGGKYAEALYVFEQIQGPVDAKCLRALLYACSAGEPPRWEDALSLLHTSDIVEGTRGPAKVDSRALSYAMLACAKADQWEEALNLAELYGRTSGGSTYVNRGTVPLSTFNALLAACGRCGQPGVALRLFNEMESVYGTIPDERCYRTMVIACNQAEHYEQRRLRLGIVGRKDDEDGFQWWECALSLLRRMKESNLQIDPQTYSSVISACEAAGQWQRALGVLQSMMKSKDKTVDDYSRLNLYCFNAAISACAKGGAWVEALELYYRMIDKGGTVTPNFITLSSILVALDKAGQKELAQSTYEEGVRDGVVTPWKLATTRDRGKIRAMDLHRFAAATAHASVRSVIESLLSSEPDHDMSEDLVIIVGKGKGSEDKPVLLPAVRSLLERDYGIHGFVDATNAGRFVIPSKALKAFVDKHEWEE